MLVSEVIGNLTNIAIGLDCGDTKAAAKFKIHAVIEKLQVLRGAEIRLINVLHPIIEDANDPYWADGLSDKLTILHDGVTLQPTIGDFKAIAHAVKILDPTNPAQKDEG